jgi:hypothetical protein
MGEQGKFVKVYNDTTNLHADKNGINTVCCIQTDEKASRINCYFAIEQRNADGA